MLRRVPPPAAVLPRRQALHWLSSAGLAAWAPAMLLPACTAPLPALRVGCIVFPGYELMFLAREQGLLPDTQVRLVEMSANSDVLRALAVEQLDAAALTLDEMLSARAEGVDLRLIGVLDVSDGSDVVIGRQGITQLSQLAGLRVGVEDTATGALLLSGALKAAGLTLKQVQKVRVSLGESARALNADEVDVVVTAQPWAGMLEAKGAVRLFDSRQMPDTIIDVLAARAEVCERRGPALQLLLRAHFDALRHFQANPLAAAALMAPRLQVNPAEVPETLQGLVLPDAARNKQLLTQPEGVQAAATRLAQVMLDERLVARRPGLEHWIEPRFLPTS
jgi:NitT/TauT family transport system substrate-binding protein